MKKATFKVGGKTVTISFTEYRWNPYTNRWVFITSNGAVSVGGESLLKIKLK